MKVHLSSHYIPNRPSEDIIPAGHSHIYEAGIHYRLLLVSGAEHTLYSLKEEEIQAHGAYVYLIPPGQLCRIKSLEQNLSIVTLDFKAHSHLCNADCPNRIKEIALKRKETKAIEQEEGQSQSRPRRRNIRITQLPMTQALSFWRASCQYLLNFEEVELKHFDNKIEEFFLLLRLAYSREEREEFLRYYHCRIAGFRELIISSYHSRMDVSDLYALGSDLALNEIAFKRSFRDEFGSSPREWLVEQRAKAIYRELVESDKPLKALSQEFGFCSLSHFGSFCRQILGDTPLHIRKGR